MKQVYYWFAPRNNRLGYGDDRVVRLGRTHKIKGMPELCERGFHASSRPLDALKYAHSSILYGVELGGEIVHGDDKSAATERTYLWRLDCDDLLRRFARKSALDVIHLWNAPEIVVQYLKTGDESIRAAADAATRVATQVATQAATWGAARAAAQAATRAATWGATRAATIEKMNRRLVSMIAAERRRAGR